MTPEIVSALLPHFSHFYAAGGAPSSSVNLGQASVGAPLAGANSIGGKINSITGTAAEVVGPLSLLGMIWGGLVHTQVFHTPQAKEQGKEILKGSAFGLIIAVLAPLAVKALSSL